MASYLEKMAFYFGVFLPSLPYVVFMIVVVGWILAVLQSLIAAPLWAVMHMTPDRTFIGSQSQGYLLLLSLFARPALAVIGLFAAMLVSDPIIDFIAKGFFSMRGAVVTSTGTVGAITSFFTLFWWFSLFGLTLLPVLYMAFGLPQILPDQVLRWIGAGIGDLGETQAAGQIRGSMASFGDSLGTGGGGSLGAGGAAPKTALGRRGPGLLEKDRSGNGPLPDGRPKGDSTQPLNANPQGVTPQAPETPTLATAPSASVPRAGRAGGAADSSAMLQQDASQSSKPEESLELDHRQKE